jgi:drug/metabolite transporter (DMT)-like permease
MQKKSLYGLTAGLTAASIWGGMYVVSKVVMETIPPFTLITLRLVLGIAVLYAIISWRGGINISSPLFWQVLRVGFVGYGISIGFQFVGTNLSTAANGSLVTSATPAFVLLFAAIILKERITIRRLLALIIASLGVIAVIDPRTAQLNPGLFWGNISLVLAAITWALYSVLIRKVTRDVDVLTTSLIAFMGGLVVCVPLSGLELTRAGVGMITPGVIAGVLFLGIISTALAMFLWNTAFAELPAGTASLTFFAQPVVGTILGVIFLGDQITPLFIIGGVLIGIGILISARE